MSSSVGSPAVYRAQKTIVTPPHSWVAQPLVTAISLGDAFLESLSYYVPSGSSGALAWQVLYAGAPLYPWGDATETITVSDERDTIIVGTEIGSSLTVETYNTGSYPHALYLQFAYVPMSVYSTAPPSANIVAL